MKPQWMRNAGLGLATVWAVFWIYFATGESVTAGNIVPAVITTAVFGGSLLLAWKNSLLGGLLLVAEGLLICFAYTSGFLHPQQLETVMFVIGTLAVPPIAGGLLLVAEWTGSRLHPTD